MTAAPAAKEEKVDHAYYEELQSQLKEALSAKKAADKALSGIEDQIEKFEGPASLRSASSIPPFFPVPLSIILQSPSPLLSPLVQPPGLHDRADV